MLFPTKAFVVVALRHEQLLEVGEAVEFACSQSVVVQPVSGTLGSRTRDGATDLRDERQWVHLKQDLCIFAPLNSTFSKAYRILPQMEQSSF